MIHLYLIPGSKLNSMVSAVLDISNAHIIELDLYSNIMLCFLKKETVDEII